MAKLKTPIDIETKLEINKKQVYDILGSQKDNILVIKDVQTYEKYIADCIAAGRIDVDTETNNTTDALTCKLMGLCLYAPGLKQAYIPVNHRDYKTKIRLDWQLTEEQIRIGLLKVIDSKIPIIMHNGKFDYKVIKCTCGVEVKPSWDTMIAAKLLDENEKKFGLKDLYTSKIDKNQEKYDIEKLFKGIEYADLDPEVFALYAATDSMMTDKLYELQEPIMKSHIKIRKLFEEIEMKIVVIAAEMELKGIAVDLDYCERLNTKYSTELKDIEDELKQCLVELEPVIEEWRKTSNAKRRERQFYKGTKNNYTLEELIKKYPFVDSVSDKRYKLGPRRTDKLKNPINLGSSEQLAILIYNVLRASVVDREKPKSTENYALEEILSRFENSLYLDRIIEEKGFSYLGKLLLIEFVRFENSNGVGLGVKHCELAIKLISLILKKRKLEKLISTYISNMEPLASHYPDNKIRFQFYTLGAKTGRFSSGGKIKFYSEGKPVELSGCNIQNIPEKNKEIRLLFKADQGRVLVGGDFKSQEPRLAAHLSNDPGLIEAFEQNLDIYASIAASALGNNYEDNLEEYVDEDGNVVHSLEGKYNRTIGKTLVLASLYGMTGGTFTRRINDQKKKKAKKENTEDELELHDIEWGIKKIEEFFAAYPKLKQAMDKAVEDCKKFGYVEDIAGRRRRLPNINKPILSIRYEGKFEKIEERLNKYCKKITKLETDDEVKELIEEAANYKIFFEEDESERLRAERQCFNAMIQGSAASLTKMTMILINEDPFMKQWDAHMLIQVHDEIILDCPEEHAEKVKVRLAEIMEWSKYYFEITVPMGSDTVVLHRWGEDGITTKLLETYEEYLKKNTKEEALELVCSEYPEFPKESILKVLEDENKETPLVF